MPNLPEEIINDILLRLPVKSLLKFKCVSKSWRSLVSDPRFIKSHLHMSAKNNYANHRVLMKSMQRPYYFKSFSLHTFFNEPYLDGIEFPHPYPRNISRMVGSCNGLFCSTITININDDIERIFLWNPSTRESRWLPDPGFKVTTSSDLLYGLGYDCSIDDYKLVVIRRAYQNYGIYHDYGEMKVYTLRSNSWRDIQPYPSGLPEPSRYASGIFLGGALIWHIVPAYPRKILKIPAFDLAMETFQELSTPVIEDGDAWNIGVLGECLCFVVNYKYVNVDVWVMKEYGVSESWTKLLSVPYVRDILSSKTSYYHPIWLSKNGEILLQFKSTFWVVYDPKKYTIKFEEINRFIDPMSCGPCVYIESLVSPNPMLRITDFWMKKKQSTTS